MPERTGLRRDRFRRLDGGDAIQLRTAFPSGRGPAPRAHFALPAVGKRRMDRVSGLPSPILPHVFGISSCPCVRFRGPPAPPAFFQTGVDEESGEPIKGSKEIHPV